MKENDEIKEEIGKKNQKKIKDLEDKLKKCEKEKDEYLNGWQRAKADFINFRKEREKQQENFVKFSNELIISDILPILDSFDLAVKIEPELVNGIEKINGTLRGMLLIKSQLLDVLKKYGLEPFDSVGQKFNPEIHEAIAEEIGTDEGLVLEEILKGYRLYGKVIRPAKVKISK